jgi:tetratricopeptide (TPR) repeat protein
MMPLSGAAFVVARAVALLLVLTPDGGRVTPAPSPPPASSGPAPVARDGATALSRLDWLYQRRDDPATFAEAHRLASEAVAAAPMSYEALWRAARETFSETDQPHRSPDERSRLGKAAYDLAERAIAVNPNGVAGYYWATLGIGRHAETMGVVRALANGIEGKFVRPLERATALDVRYDHGNIPVVWAAYYLELPWPKRDRAKAAAKLRQALEINPANLRARLYQAQLALAEDRPADARALLDGIAAAPVGRYDAPEERAVKKEAAALAATVPRAP